MNIYFLCVQLMLGLRKKKNPKNYEINLPSFTILAWCLLTVFSMFKSSITKKCYNSFLFKAEHFTFPRNILPSKDMKKLRSKGISFLLYNRSYSSSDRQDQVLIQGIQAWLCLFLLWSLFLFVLDSFSFNFWCNDLCYKNECLCFPQNSYIETLNTQSDNIRRWGLWKVLRFRWGYEGGSFMIRLVSL